MKNLILEINREDVLEHIYKSSAYTARSREAMGIPVSVCDTMQATTDNANIIEPLLEKSVVETESIIREYFQGNTIVQKEKENGIYYEFEIPVPCNFPEGCKANLEKLIGDYMAQRTMHQWYIVVKPDEAGIAATVVNETAANIRRLLTTREKPHMTSTQTEQE